MRTGIGHREKGLQDDNLASSEDCLVQFLAERKHLAYFSSFRLTWHEAQHLKDLAHPVYLLALFHQSLGGFDEIILPIVRFGCIDQRLDTRLQSE